MNNFFDSIGIIATYGIFPIIIIVIFIGIRVFIAKGLGISSKLMIATSWIVAGIAIFLSISLWSHYMWDWNNIKSFFSKNDKTTRQVIPITPDSPYHLSPVYPGTDSTVNYGKFAAHIQWDNLVTEGYTVDTLHKNTTDTTYLVKTPLADPGNSWAMVGLQTNYKYYRSCGKDLTEIKTGNDPSIKLGVKSRFAAIELKHRWDQKTTIFLYQIPNSLTDSTSLYLNTKGFCI